jgi:hypothetical protein
MYIALTLQPEDSQRICKAVDIWDNAVMFPQNLLMLFSECIGRPHSEFTFKLPISDARELIKEIDNMEKSQIYVKFPEVFDEVRKCLEVVLTVLNPKKNYDVIFDFLEK